MASCPRSVNLSKRIRKVNYKIPSGESERGSWSIKPEAPLHELNSNRLFGCGFRTLCLSLNCLGRLAVSFNFDAAGFCFRALRERNSQKPVPVIGGCSFGRNRIRQSERPQKTAVGPLYPMVVVGVVLLFEVTLAAERDRVIFNR